MLAEPVWYSPSDLLWSVHRDASVGKSIDEAGISHPHLGQRVQVGVDRYVNFESWVGETQVHILAVDDDPVVAMLGRH